MFREIGPMIGDLGVPLSLSQPQCLCAGLLGFHCRRLCRDGERLTDVTARS